MENRKHTSLSRICQIGLHACLLAAMVFLISWKLPAADFHADFTNHSTNPNLYAFSSHGYGSTVQGPYNSRHITHSIHNIIEPEEDDVQPDGLDWDNYMSTHDASVIQLSEAKKLSTIPAQFLVTRTSVPLFVLFHSWKNFLS